METLKAWFNALQAWITAHPYYTTIIVLVLSFMVVVGALAQNANGVPYTEECFSVDRITKMEQNVNTPGLGYFLLQDADHVHAAYILMNQYIEAPFPVERIDHLMVPYGAVGQTGSTFFFFEEDGCAFINLTVPMESELMVNMLGLIAHFEIDYHMIGKGM